MRFASTGLHRALGTSARCQSTTATAGQDAPKARETSETQLKFGDFGFMGEYPANPNYEYHIRRKQKLYAVTSR